jgi:hypothetical protein
MEITDTRFASLHTDPRFARTRGASSASADPRFSGAVAAADPRFRAAAPAASRGAKRPRSGDQGGGKGARREVDAGGAATGVGGGGGAPAAADARFAAAAGWGKGGAAAAVAPAAVAAAARAPRGPGGDGGAPRTAMEARLARLTAASRGEVAFSGSSSGSESDSDDGGSAGGGAAAKADGGSAGGGAAAEAAASQRAMDALDGPDVPVDPDAPSLAAPERSTAEGEETRRLALVNLDWEQLRAVDIFALLQSVVPERGGGALLRVAVHPSNYGLARMEEEARHGPTRLFAAAVAASEAAAAAAAEGGGGGGRRRGVLQPAKASAASGAGAGRGARLDKELVRKYELNKLKYFFAVAEFDCAATAAAVYEAADGLEMENSSNVLDLRFVPDDTAFPAPPRDVAEGVPDDYAPCVFPRAQNKRRACAPLSRLSPRAHPPAPSPPRAVKSLPRARCSQPTWSSLGRATTCCARATSRGNGSRRRAALGARRSGAQRAAAAARRRRRRRAKISSPI